MTDTPRFTIVAPMRNEVRAVAEMAAEIEAACADIGPFEAIFVDDGSTDGTAEAVAAAASAHPWLRCIRHKKSCGQSAAVLSGVRAARAPVICTIDGDGQNPPSEIPALVSPLLAEDAPARLGLVAGQRIDRRDTASKRLASRLANRLRRALLHDDTRDTGCGLKAFPRELFLRLPFFDHIHRYLPALVRREGYDIALVDVSHRLREDGRSNYSNIGRARVGALDLVGVWWLCHRRKLPEIAE